MRLAVREARVLEGLDHPNLVKMLAAFKSKSGRVYLVFEFVGPSLHAQLDLQPTGLAPPATKLLAWQLINGVSYLHDAKILHRDIKPANVLLCPSGVAKVCDFGFARSVSCGPRDVQRCTTYCVTRWYRAPEVLVGDLYGAAADVWSIGCTIAEAATGRPLFPGATTPDQLLRIMSCLGPLTPAQAVTAATFSDLAPLITTPPLIRKTLRQRLPELEPRLFELIEACLQVDPRRRPTVRELLQMPYFWDARRIAASVPPVDKLMAAAAAGGSGAQKAAAASSASSQPKTPAPGLERRPAPESTVLTTAEAATAAGVVSTAHQPNKGGTADAPSAQVLCAAAPLVASPGEALALHPDPGAAAPPAPGSFAAVLGRAPRTQSNRAGVEPPCAATLPVGQEVSPTALDAQGADACSPDAAGGPSSTGAELSSPTAPAPAPAATSGGTTGASASARATSGSSAARSSAAARVRALAAANASRPPVLASAAALMVGRRSAAASVGVEPAYCPSLLGASTRAATPELGPEDSTRSGYSPTPVLSPSQDRAGTEDGYHFLTATCNSLLQRLDSSTRRPSSDVFTSTAAGCSASGNAGARVGFARMLSSVMVESWDEATTPMGAPSLHGQPGFVPPHESERNGRVGSVPSITLGEAKAPKLLQRCATAVSDLLNMGGLLGRVGRRERSASCVGLTSAGRACVGLTPAGRAALAAAFASGEGASGSGRIAGPAGHGSTPPSQRPYPEHMSGSLARTRAGAAIAPVVEDVEGEALAMRPSVKEPAEAGPCTPAADFTSGLQPPASGAKDGPPAAAAEGPVLTMRKSRSQPDLIELNAGFQRNEPAGVASLPSAFAGGMPRAAAAACPVALPSAFAGTMQAVLGGGGGALAPPSPPSGGFPGPGPCLTLPMQPAALPGPDRESCGATLSTTVLSTSMDASYAESAKTVRGLGSACVASSGVASIVAGPPGAGALQKGAAAPHEAGLQPPYRTEAEAVYRKEGSGLARALVRLLACGAPASPSRR
ncbi:hypothetical protein HYH03_016920 [Edaphochlamys debaryana]|uniref:Protein kinase domain-containing protein n=1 Tax=Edaphochlamys debaryana TaxID=47281 RepID=A0A835XI76_9CHLO|nr:hypothetical protein HYH03_016920 [Edaphochlamys debaryana]|eukprot:KAG2484276.1 hypothetical protein HYH03_016920 [Edaphochlamys debaryana]